VKDVNESIYKSNDNANDDELPEDICETHKLENSRKKRESMQVIHTAAVSNTKQQDGRGISRKTSKLERNFLTNEEVKSLDTKKMKMKVRKYNSYLE
jgi:hypothetical protein